MNGDGTGQNISGLLVNSTPYSGTTSGTRIDTIAAAIEQVGASGFQADAIVVSLFDFWQIATTKSTIGTYILGDVQSSPVPPVWSPPLVVSQVIANGTFLVGAFNSARPSATVRTRHSRSAASIRITSRRI